jgi:hypothetical protein
MTLPYRIKSIIDQTGGEGLGGAFCYIGAQNFVYLDRDLSSSEFKDGMLTFSTGLLFKVNGGWRGWKMAITLEPNDTYTVRLMAVRRDRAKLLDEVTDVYCDMLKFTVESMYDNAVNKYSGGFISV